VVTADHRHARVPSVASTDDGTYKLSIVDYELKVDKYLGPGCK
jgi:hypothetical protein